jgi:hypothetical protein
LLDSSPSSLVIAFAFELFIVGFHGDKVLSVVDVERIAVDYIDLIDVRLMDLILGTFGLV